MQTSAKNEHLAVINFCSRAGGVFSREGESTPEFELTEEGRGWGNLPKFIVSGITPLDLGSLFSALRPLAI